MVDSVLAVNSVETGNRSKHNTGVVMLVGIYGTLDTHVGYRYVGIISEVQIIRLVVCLFVYLLVSMKVNLFVVVVVVVVVYLSIATA